MSKPASVGHRFHTLGPDRRARRKAPVAFAGSTPPVDPPMTTKVLLGLHGLGTEAASASSFSIRCHCSYSHIILSICLRHRSAYICALPTSLLTRLQSPVVC